MHGAQLRVVCQGVHFRPLLRSDGQRLRGRSPDLVRALFSSHEGFPPLFEKKERNLTPVRFFGCLRVMECSDSSGTFCWRPLLCLPLIRHDTERI